MIAPQPVLRTDPHAATSWTRYAQGYLALVHEEVRRNPEDAQMCELLRAMQAALANPDLETFAVVADGDAQASSAARTG